MPWWQPGPDSFCCILSNAILVPWEFVCLPLCRLQRITVRYTDWRPSQQVRSYGSRYWGCLYQQRFPGSLGGDLLERWIDHTPLLQSNGDVWAIADLSVTTGTFQTRYNNLIPAQAMKLMLLIWAYWFYILLLFDLYKIIHRFTW